MGIGPEWFESHIGPTFLEHAPSACSDDQETALMAIRSFLNESVATPISARDMELAMGWNMLVQPWVRANLIAREEDFTQELARIAKPVLVSYGEKDSVVLPKMAETIAKQVRHAQISIYEGVGHAPFIEDPDRFNSELGSFVDATLNR